MTPALETRIRVLLVGLSRPELLLIKSCLVEGHFKVETAPSLDRVELGNYDAVFIDSQGSGPALEGVREIRDWERRNGAAHRLIVALMSSEAGLDVSAINADRCTAFLRKPVSKVQLSEALQGAEARSDSLSRPVQPRQAPPALAALVPKYLEGRQQDILMLRAALEQGNFKEIARLGHNLKGTGSPYGFPEITQIGRSLEVAGKESDGAEANRSIGRLESYVRSQT